MRLASATLYPLRLPFVETFRHAAKDRAFSDSVIVALRDETGNVGFGEGIPRPYLTGETQEGMIEQLRSRFWPSIRGRELPAPSLQDVDSWVSDQPHPGILADHGSRAALTTAILDCTLRAANRSLADLLPPVRSRVLYSGVITAGPIEKAVEHASQMKLVGLRQIKLKVGYPDDAARARAVREVLGQEASLRVDANGAWTFDQAVATLTALAPNRIDAVEQPLPRGEVDELVRLRAASPIPIMADESLITLNDARSLAAARAVDFFNIRISKCGGLHRSLAISQIANDAGIRIQIGSLVGETAILSAAGRHLAAALADVAFVEGSYGTLLLAEDLSSQSLRFGHRGEAPVLTGPGLGVEVLPALLHKYAIQQIELR
jgi:muconate cycloisomerase